MNQTKLEPFAALIPIEEVGVVLVGETRVPDPTCACSRMLGQHSSWLPNHVLALQWGGRQMRSESAIFVLLRVVEVAVVEPIDCSAEEVEESWLQHLTKDFPSLQRKLDILIGFERHRTWPLNRDRSELRVQIE